MNPKFFTFLTFLAPLVFVKPILASTSLTISQSILESNFQITSIGDFIGAIVLLLFMIAAILVFVYFIWGGLQWVTSGGDSASTAKARDRITAAMIGLSIIALSYALIIIIQYFFGINVVGNNSLLVPKPY